MLCKKFKSEEILEDGIFGCRNRMPENIESSIHHGWQKWKIWFNSLERNSRSMPFNVNTQKKGAWKEND